MLSSGGVWGIVALKVVGIFGHQLRTFGHEIVWEESNSKWYLKDYGYNIIVEGFTPGSVALVREAYEKGARFICLATEEPTPKGFNWGNQEEMRKRQIVFEQAAPYLEGILYLVPGQFVHDWYNQWAPAAYVELGYAPTLYRPSWDEPEYEFGFYGSLSHRRYNILKKLTKRMYGYPKAVRIVADFATQMERDKEMRNCKIILQIRKFESMGLVSSSRCNTALHLGRPIICEPHQLSKPWDEVVTFTNSMEGFFAEALCRRSTWKGLWRDQFERFQAKFSPQHCVGEPLRAIGFDGQRFPERERRVAA